MKLFSILLVFGFFQVVLYGCSGFVSPSIGGSDGVEATDKDRDNDRSDGDSDRNNDGDGSSNDGGDNPLLNEGTSDDNGNHGTSQDGTSNNNIRVGASQTDWEYGIMPNVDKWEQVNIDQSHWKDKAESLKAAIINNGYGDEHFGREHYLNHVNDGGSNYWYRYIARDHSLWLAWNKESQSDWHSEAWWIIVKERNALLDRVEVNWDWNTGMKRSGRCTDSFARIESIEKKYDIWLEYARKATAKCL